LWSAPPRLATTFSWTTQILEGRREVKVVGVKVVGVKAAAVEVKAAAVEVVGVVRLPGWSWLGLEG
jgi:hypothetical protein